MSREFFEPWMARCNSQLILRLWRHKGSPGRLTLPNIYGLKMTFINTVVGELCIKQEDIFQQLFRRRQI